MEISSLSRERRTAVAETLLLVLIVLASALPYLGGLGFYSDDWGYVAAMSQASPPRLGALFHQLMLNDAPMIIRPVQVAYLIVGYKLFGAHPFGYHISNSLLLGLVAALVYLVARKLAFTRGGAFALAAIFSTLPHYSSNRVWISTHQATLSMFFGLLGIYALLSGFDAERRRAMWGALSALSMVLSVLAYEITLGLILVTIAAAWVRIYLRRREDGFRWGAYSNIIIPSTVFFVAGLVKALTQHRMVYRHHLFTHLGEVARHAIVVAAKFTVVTYGVKMPAVLMAMARQSALSRSAIAAAIIVAVVAGLWAWKSKALPLGRGASAWLIIVGFLLFFLGSVFFLPSVTTDISSAGSINRVAAASALGAACIWLGLLGLLCSIVSSEAVRVRVFACALAVIVAANTLAVNGIAHFWTNANIRQKEIISNVSANVRSLRPNSVLLLDGFCRFEGPAVVFEADWDALGAMQMAFHDPTLKSDVVSPNLMFVENEVRTINSGEPQAQYAYSERLYVYNVRTRELRHIPDASAAREYMRETAAMRSQLCPTARDGYGEKMF